MRKVLPPIDRSWHRRYAIPVMKASFVSSLAGPLFGYGFLILADSRGVSHVGALSIGVAAGIASTAALGIFGAINKRLASTNPITQIEKGFAFTGREQVANLIGVDVKTVSRWERYSFHSEREEALVKEVRDLAQLLGKNTPESTRPALISVPREQLGGVNLKQAIREGHLEDARNAIESITVKEMVSLE